MDQNVKGMTHISDWSSKISSLGESLDENGARFTALLENFYHLNKVVPEEERAPGLDSRDMVWALHSQSQVCCLRAPCVYSG